jgi:hypothetical protein
LPCFAGRSIAVPGTSIGVGVGIGIGMDREVENLFFKTHTRIPDIDGDPDSDVEPQSAPAPDGSRSGDREHRCY